MTENGRFQKGFTPWNKGKKLDYAGHTTPHTAETKAKLSAAAKGRTSWAKGKSFSTEHRERLSAAHVGRRLSPEHKEKIRFAAQKLRGENNPNWKPFKQPRSKYRHIKCPPEFASMAKKNGMVMEHRLVAARSLGRPLLKGEVVDHINRNTLDNRPENLRVYESNAKHLADTLRPDSPQDMLRKESDRHENTLPCPN